MTRALPPSARELLERVEALVPELAAQAPEAERLRRPTDASIAALEQAGLFRLMVPRAYGGLELDLDAFLEVGLALSEADASIGWVSTFYVEHNWMFCQFPQAFQRELFRERAWVLAPATIAPSGHARPEDGGFRVTGRWQWGTGVMHADWVIVGSLVEGEDPAAFRFFALPAEQAKVEDTWYVDGMVGTGSNDIVVDEVFIPDERSVSIQAMVSGTAEGARIHEGPLYRTPMVPILMLAASVPAVGTARAAVRSFCERLQGQTRAYSSTPQVEKPALQMRLGRAALQVREAELLLRDVVAEVMALRADATLEDRARWSACYTRAVHQSRRVILDVAEASGASAHFQEHPLQRAVRDVNVMACHVAFDADARHELYGRMLLGLDANVNLL